MTGAEERVWQSRMESLIWSRDSVNIGPSIIGGRQFEQDEPNNRPNLVEFQIEEDKVIEAMVQTAQAHTVRKRRRVKLGGGSRSQLSPWSGVLGVSGLAARLSNRQQRRGWQECDGGVKEI
jgi:hypothetical protein